MYCTISNILYTSQKRVCTEITQTSQSSDRVCCTHFDNMRVLRNAMMGVIKRGLQSSPSYLVLRSHHGVVLPLNVQASQPASCQCMFTCLQGVSIPDRGRSTSCVYICDARHMFVPGILGLDQSQSYIGVPPLACLVSP
jgi:hypothetical protein